MTDLLLAGDIGGTKADLRLVEAGTDPRRPLYSRIIPSAAHGSLESIIATFLADAPRRPRWCCLGVPGAIIDGTVKPSNLPWSASEAALARTFDLAGVRFLNDLEATAYGLLALRDEEIAILRPGSTNPHAPIAVVAPGTGLGIAALVPDGHRYRALASEGGHAAFAPSTPFQLELARAMTVQTGTVPCAESFACGPGIARIHAALALAAPELADDPTVAAQIAADPQPTALIVAAAGDPARNPRSARALAEFVVALGGIAHDLAMLLVARGGIWLAGGIPPKILANLADQRFLAPFTAPAPAFAFLADLPIRVSLEPGAAAIGAADEGLRLMGAPRPVTIVGDHPG